MCCYDRGDSHEIIVWGRILAKAPETVTDSEQTQAPVLPERASSAAHSDITITPQSIEVVPTPGDEYLAFTVKRDFDVVVSIDSAVLFGIVGAAAVIAVVRYIAMRYGFGSGRSFEIDSAEFGIGDQKITLRPNDTDRQVAYQIWVELSTRKIGLPIELENDVIDQVYNSWYNFFSVTRELIKGVPVSKFRRKDTEKIIKLSIEVLNHGIRPHLTKWQARYRRWYDNALMKEENADLSPQEIQKKYPEFDALMCDLFEVNRKLILYRDKMYQIVTRI